ncbi:MAG TPA: carboxypeptidase-like regulatory domain-containing protein [Bryobacteraceae bacterium]|nr:carboxypeptidase-like regulatory domain-containing protein [Bryobacteraceae bacterium]
MPRIIALFIVSFSLLAQDRGEFSISGVVVNEQTGEPIKYALVTLMGFRKAEPSQAQQPLKMPQPVQKSIQAGPAGEFRFNGLLPATYSLNAQKPGFNFVFRPGAEMRRSIELTASVSGIQVKLSPLGVIEGKVVDQNDEPLRGVNIIALQAPVVDGERETHSVRSVATDDRGIYRLWNLASGQYYIKAAGKSGGTYRYVADTTPYYSSWQSFAPVYFGGSRTLDAAQPIEIAAGSNVSAEFHLNIEPGFKIRGTLVNAPDQTVTFDLLQGTEDVSASRTSLNASTGRFEVQDVTPGSYILRATQEGKLRGEALVTVGAGDVDGVPLAMAPAVTVKGITRVIGTPLSVKQMPGFPRALQQEGLVPHEVAEQMNQPIPVDCNVALHERGGGSHSVASQRIRARAAQEEENGAFSIADVLPGTYRVRVQCSGGYPMSVLSGGVDLLANPELIVPPGAVPPPIEVQAKAGGGTLHGTLDVEQASQGAGLLLVPASATSGGPSMFPVWGEMHGQGKMQFMQPFLAPGDYTVYAFSKWQEVEFRNPAFLQTLSGGVSAHIEDGKDQEITVDRIVK